MIKTKLKTKPSFAEFVILVSLLMSLTALSIDAMLPALAQIGRDLQVQDANSRQLIITMIFVGLAAGQLFFGPLSDSTGRKPAIYAGMSLFIVGSIASMAAARFPVMLIGRLLQGIGISAPRAVTMALVRDQFSGRAMARVMSFVITVIILMPMVAPSMGQAILLFFGWRAIFGSFVLLTFMAAAWLALRQPETLAPENRVRFSWQRTVSAIREILKSRAAFGYTLTSGLVFGAFIGYLNSAQQIFQEQYKLGTLFPLYFATIAAAIGVASFVNSRLVMRFGMRLLVQRSLVGAFVLSAVALATALLTGGQPPLWFFTAFLMLSFFCVGILFGNMNALAMEPLGHVAGIGAAVVGALSTLISTILGTLIGQSYNGTILPFVLGLCLLLGLAILVVKWAEAK